MIKVGTNSINNVNNKESHKALLEIVKYVLSAESDRKKNVETRAGILIGFTGLALINLLTSSVKVYEKGIPALKELTYDSVMFTPIVRLPIFTQYAPLISMALFSGAIICLTIALFYFIKSIGQFYQYKAIDMKSLINISIQESDYLFYMKSVAICVHALNENRQLTEKKIGIFSSGFNMLLWAVILLLMWYFFYHL